jgi:hypothetical protein
MGTIIVVYYHPWYYVIIGKLMENVMCFCIGGCYVCMYVCECMCVCMCVCVYVYVSESAPNSRLPVIFTFSDKGTTESVTHIYIYVCKCFYCIVSF